MKNVIFGAAAAGALALSPVAAAAQTAPAPATETVSAESSLVGIGRADEIIGITFFLSIFVIVILKEILEDEDREESDNRVSP